MASQDPNRHPQQSERTAVPAVQTVRSARPRVPTRQDVVFDFDGRNIVDLMGLSMVLTARQIAENDAALVWIKDVPPRTLALLRALGVDSLFGLFPEPSSQPS